MKKKIIKPFDMEAAKNGAKVETKVGLPVRIICYDKKDVYPIIALITTGNIERCFSYTKNGELYNHIDLEDNLVIVEEVEELERWADRKDEQPISELGGWHKEEPTEDGWYLIKSNDRPKNCECMVAEWDSLAKHFFSEADDEPVSYREWKLIEKR